MQLSGNWIFRVSNIIWKWRWFIQSCSSYISAISFIPSYHSQHICLFLMVKKIWRIEGYLSIRSPVYDISMRVDLLLFIVLWNVYTIRKKKQTCVYTACLSTPTVLQPHTHFNLISAQPYITVREIWYFLILTCYRSLLICLFKPIRST